MTNLWRLAALATVASFPLIAFADGTKGEASAPPQPVVNWTQGPSKIPLGHELTLDLPAEHRYLNPREAKALLEKSGNFFGDGFMGIVLSKQEANWWVAIQYADEGFIKDDDKLDADDILKSIKEGNEQANEMRKEKGLPELLVDGWSEPPHYDKALHHLVWAIEGHDSQGKTTNYNTRILGRKGVVSLNLITDPTTLATDKPEVQKLLQRTTFNLGARYADFNSKTDKVASYGLAALVAGGAGVAALKIAKIGIFAKFGKVILLLFAKFFKIIIGAFIALWLGIKRLFGVADKTPPAPPSMVDQAGNPPTPAASDEQAAPSDPNGSSGSSGPSGTA